METELLIEWGDKKYVSKNINSINELIESGYLDKYAKNFGYEHLINKEVDFLKKLNILKIYIVVEDEKHNYGLDFSIWYLHKGKGVNEDMKFLNELSFIKSMTSAPMMRVLMITKAPDSLNLDNIESINKNELEEFLFNMQNNVIEGFRISKNAGYKKDSNIRELVRKECIKNDFVLY